MKRAAIAFGTVALALLACSVAFNARAATSAKQQIIAFEHKCIAATTTDQALACDDLHHIVVYDFSPPLEYAGAKAVRADLNNFFDNAKDIKGEFLQLDVVSDGKLGMARSIQHFTWTGKDGKPMQGTFRVTDVMHKVDGQWKIFHTHVSVPVNPTTGKGEMDLKLATPAENKQ